MLELIVAIVVVALLHTPPAEELKVVVEPTQRLVEPDIAKGPPTTIVTDNVFNPYIGQELFSIET